jgi:UDP-GlcNAc3NAcA epimerase
MKIVSVVGARPEFIQAMPVSRAIRAHHREILVHTGQHYDYKMSQTFFDELEIQAPDYNLEVGSGSQARQTAEMMIRFEEVLGQEKPDLVIIRGDTNSTLAGAITASKLNIPLVHIEAGERSFNRTMPEEINRLVADRLADDLFCVSQAAVRNLAVEGITESVHWVGDVMLDALIYAQPIARKRSYILEKLQISPKLYALVTIHRAANTDDPERLRQIVTALNSVSETVIWPVHPRSVKALESLDMPYSDHIRRIDPVGYFDMLVLEENARLIATDSGGVQREAYYLAVPCLTLRDETEWIATVEVGWNKLVGVDQNKILEVWLDFAPPVEHPPIYGDGSAALQIVESMNAGGMKTQKHDPIPDNRMPAPGGEVRK